MLGRGPQQRASTLLQPRVGLPQMNRATAQMNAGRNVDSLGASHQGRNVPQQPDRSRAKNHAAAVPATSANRDVRRTGARTTRQETGSRSSNRATKTMSSESRTEDDTSSLSESECSKPGVEATTSGLDEAATEDETEGETESEASAALDARRRALSDEPGTSCRTNKSLSTSKQTSRLMDMDSSVDGHRRHEGEDDNIGEESNLLAEDTSSKRCCSWSKEKSSTMSKEDVAHKKNAGGGVQREELEVEAVHPTPCSSPEQTSKSKTSSRVGFFSCCIGRNREKVALKSSAVRGTEIDEEDLIGAAFSTPSHNFNKKLRDHQPDQDSPGGATTTTTATSGTSSPSPSNNSNRDNTARSLNRLDSDVEPDTLLGDRDLSAIRKNVKDRAAKKRKGSGCCGRRVLCPEFVLVLAVALATVVVFAYFIYVTHNEVRKRQQPQLSLQRAAEAAQGRVGGDRDGGEGRDPIHQQNPGGGKSPSDGAAERSRSSARSDASRAPGPITTGMDYTGTRILNQSDPTGAGSASSGTRFMAPRGASDGDRESHAGAARAG
ncbi:unnamed protein product [Amoebophrya sp. A25]|nr:unnamed protein product [Amoebophrya sp. A25]|eukprot:GSA25T00005970001.1